MAPLDHVEFSVTGDRPDCARYALTTPSQSESETPPASTGWDRGLSTATPIAAMAMAATTSRRTVPRVVLEVAGAGGFAASRLVVGIMRPMHRAVPVRSEVIGEYFLERLTEP